MADFLKYQDVFGQLMFLKTYTQVLLCFPIPERVDLEDITKELERAALKLTETFPWLAGQVINEGSGPGNSGLFKIVPYEPHATNAPLRVKDCSKICLTYDEIIQAKAPMSMLDGDVLAPRKGLPLSYDESKDPAPVMIIQANFITGGLLLSFSGQHNAMDMNGQGQLIRLFAKACRGDAFTEAEVAEGNRDRRTIIHLLSPDEPLLDHSMLRPLPSANGPQFPSKVVPTSWAYFHFPTSRLEQLKSLASQSSAQDPLVPWVSTNDALSAFIWQRISSARLLRRKQPEATATFARAVSARRCLRPAVPEAYMGHMVSCTFDRLTFQQITTLDLSALASLIRKSLNELDDYAVRSLVTLIAREPDKSTVSYGVRLDLDTDLLFSSWADLRLYETDFGPLLGKPDCVRRQRFVPMESLIYLMPRTEEGDIDAAICLKDVDMEALKGDREWTAYATFIG
jgi:hypothetical protein